MSTRSEQLVARRHAAVARGVGQFAGNTTAASGVGSKLLDADGRELLDFAGGIGVLNAGHCPPEVVEAVREQAGKLTHACIHVATYEPYVELCEKLAQIVPHGQATKAMLVNSGAEAVENAVKIARQATGRPAIITFSEAFHGRTLLATTLTSKTGYKTGCGPFAPEIYRLPFPNRFRYGDGLSEETLVQRELQRLRDCFVNTVAAGNVAAIIIEPVQGEGGFVPAPFAYLRGLRKICDEHGIMLICDEVQSGFYRTGKWASYEHAGVTPDLSTWAKSMASGFPIAAVVGKASVIDAALPGTIGGTYGGNPVACAAALATIALMEKRDMASHAERVGSRVRQVLEELRERCPVVADVRGLGAMIAAELCFDRDPRKPAGAVLASALGMCRDEGVLVLPASAYGNVVRVLSPLVISDDDLNRGLSVLASSIETAAKKRHS